MQISKKVVQLGIDLGKNAFHLFGVEEFGSTVLKKKLSRKQMLKYFANLPTCLIWHGGLRRQPLLGARAKRAGT